EPLASMDRDREPTIRWRERAHPKRIIGARRVVRVIEIQGHGVAVCVGAEVRALDSVQQIAAGAVRFVAARAVFERNEQTASVAQDPESGEAEVLSVEVESQLTDAPE